MQKIIDVKKIDPSPYQIRKHFDENKLKELAATIRREGLIGPIMVRLNGGRYELIAGERRLRAARDYTEIKSIAAQVVKANDLEARRISAAENLQREDLFAIEMIEGTVEMVDAELIEDIKYQRSEIGSRKEEMGKKPADRVKTLLGKLDSMRRNKERGYRANEEIRHTSHKFVQRVEKIFKNLPKPLEWRSSCNHDLALLMEFFEAVTSPSTP